MRSASTRRATANANGLLEYAQKLTSSPGRQDGLYWETKEGEPPSPVGPLVARARGQGYGHGGSDVPYHGYLYKILTGQGKDAPGGAYDYVVDGRMIGGFGLVAYPARWGKSGVMTFICNHDGVVYERNLGRNTQAIAPQMTRVRSGHGLGADEGPVSRRGPAGVSRRSTQARRPAPGQPVTRAGSRARRRHVTRTLL